MQRSRIVQTLNVPQRVRLGPSLAAALLDSLFEHPAGVRSCCATRGDHRSSAVAKWIFRSLRGRELLLSLICQRSIQRIHPVEDVLQTGSPGHHTGRSDRLLGRVNEV